MVQDSLVRFYAILPELLKNNLDKLKPIFWLVNQLGKWGFQYDAHPDLERLQIGLHFLRQNIWIRGLLLRALDLFDLSEYILEFLAFSGRILHHPESILQLI